MKAWTDDGQYHIDTRNKRAEDGYEVNVEISQEGCTPFCAS